ncbi:MAG: replication initiation protein [Sarcina sp.]
MEKEKLTKISNQIIFNLLKDYSVVEIKILTTIINRFISNYKKMENENFADYELEDLLELGITKEYFDSYRGRKKLSVKEVDKILKLIASMGLSIKDDYTYTQINIISKIEYNERYESFRITFNEEAIEYLILIQENFTLVDLNVVKDLSGKYELGIYLLTTMYKGTGIVFKHVDWMKDFFGTNANSGDLKRSLESAINKLNKKYDYNINLEFETKRKRIEKIILRFKRR